jgi:hypothetical protein
MIITIIQELWKKNNKENFLIVKVVVVTWRSEISDCILSLSAYLH